MRELALFSRVPELTLLELSELPWFLSFTLKSPELWELIRLVIFLGGAAMGQLLEFDEIFVLLDFLLLCGNKFLSGGRGRVNERNMEIRGGVTRCCEFVYF